MNNGRVSLEESGGEEEPPSAFVNAIRRGGISGWASYLTFAWAEQFLRLGASKTLQEGDLMGVDDTCKRCVGVRNRERSGVHLVYALPLLSLLRPMSGGILDEVFYYEHVLNTVRICMFSVGGLLTSKQPSPRAMKTI